MPTMLEERPTLRDREVTVRVVTEDARPRQAGRRLTFGGVLATAGLGLVGLLVVALLSGGIFALLGIGNPFSGTTTDHSPRVLLKELRDLSDFQAAEATFQSRVELETDVPILPSLIAGSKVDFDAIGTVAATVDFSGLATDAVQVAPDGAVTISLPAPTLERAVVDPRRSRVVNRDRGLVNRVGDLFEDDPTSERELYLLASEKMGRAARESKLSVRAERNTEAMLTGLLGRLGFDRATVTFVDPAPARSGGQG